MSPSTEIGKLPYRPNVGMMVINNAGYVLVAKRIDHYSNAWQMPQGGIDPSEETQIAALRELEEETGITGNKVNIIAESKGWVSYELPPELIPKLWNGKYRGQKQKWYLMEFLGEDTDININTSDPEFSAWKWIAPKELPSAIVPFKRDVYVRILEEFQDYL